MKWNSYFDCNCTSLNYYPDIETLSCVPCPFGFLLDNDSNTCQSMILFGPFIYLFIYLFLKKI